MPNLVVSAHGGRYSNQQPTLVVPGNSEVVFYVRDGETLSIPTGQQIFDALTRDGREPGGTVVQRIFGGGKTYDYACWYAPEFAASCGLYAVHSVIAFNNLRAYTPQNPLWLSQILAEYPNRVIYWDCCRCISPAGAPLQNPPEAYPGPPAAEA